jgi:phosphoribosylamine--glycine ligase
MRLKTDLLEVLMAATEPGTSGGLDTMELQWDRRTALGVVMAAHGYPGTPRTGDVIRGLPADQPDAMVFHAATACTGEELSTSGGRVLCITVLADNVRQAQQRAYDIARSVQFDGRQYRQDIGHRAAGH